MRRIFLILILLSLQLGARTLEEYKQQFAKEMAKIDSAHELAKSLDSAEFVKNLKSVMKEQQNKGDLKAVLLIQKAVKEFESSGSIMEESLNKFPNGKKVCINF